MHKTGIQDVLKEEERCACCDWVHELQSWL